MLLETREPQLFPCEVNAIHFLKREISRVLDQNQKPNPETGIFAEIAGVSRFEIEKKFDVQSLRNLAANNFLQPVSYGIWKSNRLDPLGTHVRVQKVVFDTFGDVVISYIQGTGKSPECVEVVSTLGTDTEKTQLRLYPDDRYEIRMLVNETPIIVHALIDAENSWKWSVSAPAVKRNQ